MKNVHFVLIDSMAMHGDNCNFCAPAMKKVETVSNELRCMEDKNNCEFSYSHEYSRPILVLSVSLLNNFNHQIYLSDLPILFMVRNFYWSTLLVIFTGSKISTKGQLNSE